jgi:hypothetical protein
MVPQVVALESAEAFFLFLRRVLSVYNTYKEVVDTKEKLVEFYSYSDELPKYHLGEDTYLYLLGLTLLRQAEVDKIVSRDTISWTLAETISALHERAFVRHSERVLVRFLTDVGYAITQREPGARKLFIQYKAKLTSPVTLYDPFEAAATGKNLQLSALDTNILQLLSGSAKSYDELLDVVKRAMDIQGFGYAKGNEHYKSYQGVVDSLVSREKPLHKHLLCVNLVLDGANVAFANKLRPIVIGSGATSIQLTPPLVSPFDGRNYTSLASELTFVPYITTEMVRQMAAVLTTHAGMVKLGDSGREKTYVDKRMASGTKDGADGIVFVLQKDDEARGGESATSVMLSTLKGAVVNKASKLLREKRTVRGGRFTPQPESGAKHPDLDKD